MPSPVSTERPNSSVQTINSEIPAQRKSDIESLARETQTPIAIVDEIYRIEHAKLDRVARIKTFVPVLIRRRVKELLRSQRSAPKIDLMNRPFSLG